MLKLATNLRLRCTTALAACTVAALIAVPALSAQTISAPLSVTTLAGTAGQRQAIDGSGPAARFYAPAGLVINKDGNLVVADTCNNIFRLVTPAGVVTTFAGSPINPATNPINIGSADGTGPAATFHIGEYASSGGAWDTPIYTTVGSHTLGIDAQGNVYLADTLSNTIREISPQAVVTTIAGSAGAQGSTDAIGSNARFLSPGGVAADSAGNVYIADSGNDTIRKYAVSDHSVTTFAGAARAFGSTDGTGTAARFNNPSGIAIDSANNLYVADTANDTIRKITPGGVVTTLAGKAGVSGSADGSGSAARFNGPTGIAVDASGNIYVADTKNNAIRFITPSGSVTTIAGTKGTIGSTDGTGTAALFNQPYGVTVAVNGTVYVADTQNNTIRAGLAATGAGSLQITGVPPALVQTTATSNVTLKIAATGSPAPTYQWSKNGVAISGATTDTLQLNSVTTSDAAQYAVVVTSGQVTYSSAPTQLQVFAQGTTVPTVTIVTQPTDRSVAVGGSTTFTVQASSSGTLTYQWNKNGVAIAGATASTYTISSAQTSDAAAYTVTVSDGTSTATTADANLTVTGGAGATAPVITTQPISVTIASGATATFTAGASGSPAPTYQWQKNGVNLSDGATISGATTNTLSISSVSASDAGNYTIVATNSAGTVVSTAATLTVNGSSGGTPSTAGHISNMSVLTSINAGESFTFGYFVGGSGTTGTKPLLMRAMGPTLGAAPFNIAGTLADPYMEFYNGTTLVAQNDNWSGDAAIRTAAASVGAFPFASDTSLDAAIYDPAVTLSGGHSIKVSGVNGASGKVIAELYDTTPGDQFTSTTPRLTNVSLLKNVGTTTTLGFYITGSAPVQVLIRAVGPSIGIAPFNVAGAMADPKMALYNQSDTTTPIATNDNWGGTAALQAAFSATGAFNLDPNSKDAALLETLQPGGYSVQVSPATGATGQALIEVYEVAQ